MNLSNYIDLIYQQESGRKALARVNQVHPPKARHPERAAGRQVWKGEGPPCNEVHKNSIEKRSDEMEQDQKAINLNHAESCRSYVLSFEMSAPHSPSLRALQGGSVLAMKIQKPEHRITRL